MVPSMALNGKKPVLATASVGTAEIPETVRIVWEYPDTILTL
jgi:hypothetical protein